MDEPTSSLTFKEIQSLFKVMEDLKSQGIGMFYITHRLNEVFKIATHVVLLRDGIITSSGPVENYTKDMLIKGLLPSNITPSVKNIDLNIRKACDYTKDPVLELKKILLDMDLKIYPLNYILVKF